MKIKPIRSRVYGEIIKERNEGGLIYDPFAKTIPFIFRATHCGPDCCYVEPGDIVVIPEHGGSMVNLLDTDTGETKRMFVIDEEHCLLALTDEDAIERTA
jgi:hypothetical protein